MVSLGRIGKFVRNRSSSLNSKEPEPEKDSKQDEDDFSNRRSSFVAYKKRVEHLEQVTRDVIDSRIVDIIVEDDETTRRKALAASEEQIQLEIDHLIGTRSEWSTESSEVFSFREKMIQLKEGLENVELKKNQSSKLPRVYLSPDHVNPEDERKFLCKVSLLSKSTENNISKSLLVEAKKTAGEFLEQTITKLNKIYGLDANPEEYCFKVTGRAEYLHGDHAMVEFEYIQNCLKHSKRIELTIVAIDDIGTEEQESLEELSYTMDQDSGEYDHTEMRFQRVAMETEITHISVWELERPFRVQIIGIDELSVNGLEVGQSKDSFLYVCAGLFYGGQPISKRPCTTTVCLSPYPRWFEWLEFDLNTSHLPKETQICFTLYHRTFKQREEGQVSEVHSKDTTIGWICCQVVNHRGRLRTGKMDFQMWSEEEPGSNTAVENMKDSNCGNIGICFDSYNLPVVFPSGRPPQEWEWEFEAHDHKEELNIKQKVGDNWEHELNELLKKDPLYELSEEDKLIIWHSRNELYKDPQALPIFLKSVEWTNPMAAFKARELLLKWKPLSPTIAIELLDLRFADETVRNYAVSKLDDLKDHELAIFILQLVQTLKFEPYHDSALARFLLNRAVKCPHLIGHLFFWHLKAEMHDANVRERHGLLLEEYLQACGAHRRELVKQASVVEQLLNIALLIKKTPKEDQLDILHEKLRKMKLPPVFKLPLSPKLEVKGIIISKCKIMDSQKLPLWLAFENADPTGDPILVIFKAGDDLRQDMLTLQILKLLDQTWKENGLDLKLVPYGCIATGEGVGMIEVVTESKTIAAITREKGKSGLSPDFASAFKETPLEQFLQEHNDNHMDAAVENFVYSCAGYCVATYVLGIGDRHNDNIMLSKRGHLFHIDFGHFLGNYKRFAGVSRETAPFVFTRMYGHVMGGEKAEPFKKFSDLSGKAFNITRQYGRLLMSLFQLMVWTGIPELKSSRDILWLRKCLILEASDEEAYNEFHRLIKKSLNTRRTLMNDAAHLMMHK
eukprot:gb/GECH01004784.1/.p1 GENE.gb/GECH01004784.1/~~gb/GECH01004784.1/.p1  ORF type:complete len:1016 (+),score=219.63 gb/GECH01004784.1/:1-3048(+)